MIPASDLMRLVEYLNQRNNSLVVSRHNDPAKLRVIAGHFWEHLCAHNSYPPVELEDLSEEERNSMWERYSEKR